MDLGVFGVIVAVGKVSGNFWWLLGVVADREIWEKGGGCGRKEKYLIKIFAIRIFGGSLV